MQAVGGSLHAFHRDSANPTDVEMFSTFLAENRLWWKWEPAGLYAVTGSVATGLKKRLMYATITVNCPDADPLGSIQFIRPLQVEIVFGKDRPLRDFDLPDAKDIAVELRIRTMTGFVAGGTGSGALVRVKTADPSPPFDFSIALTEKKGKPIISWMGDSPCDVNEIKEKIKKLPNLGRLTKTIEDLSKTPEKESPQQKSKREAIVKLRKQEKEKAEEELKRLEKARENLEALLERLRSRDALSFDIVVRGSGAVLAQVKVTSP